MFDCQTSNEDVSEEELAMSSTAYTCTSMYMYVYGARVCTCVYMEHAYVHVCIWSTYLTLTQVCELYGLGVASGVS